jgi:hypothetical protein
LSITAPIFLLMLSRHRWAFSVKMNEIALSIACGEQDVDMPLNLVTYELLSSVAF